MNPSYSPFIRSAQDRLSTAIQLLDHERGVSLIGDERILVGIDFRSQVTDHDTKLSQARNCVRHTLREVLNDLYRHELWVSDSAPTTSRSTQTIPIPPRSRTRSGRRYGI